MKIKALSVLLSVYKNDKKKDVADALNSILQQTWKPDQIVIVLDGSVSDSIRTMLEQFSIDNGIVDIIPLKENVGLGRALSIGLMSCKNEIVARMDSDDYSLPERFEKQLSFLEDHPSVAVVGGQIAEYDSRMENILAKRSVPISMDEISKRMKTRNAMNHVTVMYKKSAVLAAGNYQHCPYFEDYYLWCRMIKMGYIFHNLGQVLVNVRTGEEMYKRRGGKLYNEAIIIFQKKILKLGTINKFQFMTNLCVRLCVANMPNSLRVFFYRTKLRSDINDLKREESRTS